MSHTPGPWKVRQKQPHGTEVTDGHVTIAWCGANGTYSRDYSHQISSDEAEENAFLIAAAPDMYHALKELLAARHEWHPDRWQTAQDNAVANALAAIAKAERNE